MTDAKSLRGEVTLTINSTFGREAYIVDVHYRDGKRIGSGSFTLPTENGYETAEQIVGSEAFAQAYRTWLQAEAEKVRSFRETASV